MLYYFGVDIPCNMRAAQHIGAALERGDCIHRACNFGRPEKIVWLEWIKIRLAGLILTLSMGR